MFANIIPLTKLPLNKPQIYTYKVDEFSREIKIGQAVQIPFHNRTITGIVQSLNVTAEPNVKYKAVEKILNPYPIAGEIDLHLAKYVGDYYFASMGLILKHALPTLPKRKTKKFSEAVKKIKLSQITTTKKKSSNGKSNISIAIGAWHQRQTHYVEIIKHCLRNNQQILLLLPEVMLVPQTLHQLRNTFFNEEIIVLHANATKSDEIINWRKAQTNAVKIFIGTRKAIFTSFHSLGHIIVDEEQDLSYKQWDMNPRYDARTVAIQKASLYDCPLTFGANTPSVNAYFNIKNKIFNLIPLNKKKIKATMSLIDMRREMHKKNYSIFSDTLLDNLKTCLQNNKQAIVFVNRRGLATFIMCRDCGHVERCPNCNVALLEHSSNRLICNHCSFKKQIPLACPQCRSHRIKGFGAGAERVQQDLMNIFPTANIARADVTNTANFSVVQEKYDDFRIGKIDILVGTGIAMRLTSPNLSLLSVINMDSIMNFPHFRADEKSWQILKQITVRTDIETCLVQTYNPEHKLFHTNNFYEQELRDRQDLNYPPFAKMIKLICKSDDYTFIQTESMRLADELRNQFHDMEIIGPIDPINAKIRNFWLKNIIIKMPINIDFFSKNNIINNMIKNLSNYWSIDIDPLN